MSEALLNKTTLNIYALHILLIYSFIVFFGGKWLRFGVVVFGKLRRTVRELCTVGQLFIMLERVQNKSRFPRLVCSLFRNTAMNRPAILETLAFPPRPVQKSPLRVFLTSYWLNCVAGVKKKEERKPLLSQKEHLEPHKYFVSCSLAFTVASHGVAQLPKRAEFFAPHVFHKHRVSFVRWRCLTRWDLFVVELSEWLQTLGRNLEGNDFVRFAHAFNLLITPDS